MKQPIVIHILGGTVQSVTSSGEVLAIIVDEDHPTKALVYEEPVEVHPKGTLHEQFNSPYKEQIKELEDKNV